MTSFWMSPGHWRHRPIFAVGKKHFTFRNKTRLLLVFSSAEPSAQDAAQRMNQEIEMNRLALATAAILIASGGAFAGSDHFGSDNASQPVASAAGVDHATTGAVNNKTNTTGHKAA
ncbi:DUF680 domain-containing protein, partial [Mesorhizobium sp.]|uniref:DUF680 domain-containing protein n=1 Tax=Mesorhizobium sp. TaxID=1871066 RepID=UPI0025C1101F